MTQKTNLSRWQAGLIHLGVSAVVAVAALALVYLFWYPGALAQAQGVSRILLIVVCVDVVLGPVVTTTIWNPAKGNWLKFDLAVIATIQTVALLAGLEAIRDGRPAYLVFNVDRFDLVAVREVDEESLARANPRYTISFFGPHLVGARVPDDVEKRNSVTLSALMGGVDLPQMPEFFVPLADETPRMLSRKRPLRELQIINDINAEDWRRLLDEFGRSEGELAYLPMRANAMDGAVIIDSVTGHVLGIRALMPQFDSPAHLEVPE